MSNLYTLGVIQNMTVCELVQLGVKPLDENRHLCTAWSLSSGSRQPVKDGNFILDPKGERDGRKVHLLLEVPQLLFELISTVEGWNDIPNKRIIGLKGTGNELYCPAYKTNLEILSKSS